VEEGPCRHWSQRWERFGLRGFGEVTFCDWAAQREQDERWRTSLNRLLAHR